MYAATRRSRRARVVALRVIQVDQALRGREEPSGGAQREAALGAGRGHCYGPALIRFAEHVGVGHEHVVEEYFGEAFVTVEAFDAAHGHTRRREVDEEVRESVVPFGLRDRCGTTRRGACRTRHASSTSSGPTGASRRPRRRARPSIWIPARSLPAFGSDHPWHHVCVPDAIVARMRSCCSWRAELEDRRREQEDAVLRDALRRAAAVVLLFEDQPLPEARVASAVLLRPRHDRVARVEQLAFPFEVRRKARTCVARGERRPRDVGFQPRAARRREMLLLPPKTRGP